MPPPVAWNAACRAGSATFTTDPSMKASADPRMVATSTHLPFSGAHGVPAPVCISAHGSAPGDLVMTATLTTGSDASRQDKCPPDQGKEFAIADAWSGRIE